MALRNNSVSDEKDVEAIASHLDNVPTRNNQGLSTEDMEFVANFSEEKKKKVLAKIDVSCQSSVKVRS
jgi:serine kinase of HPr protein (carbohydrate metabolism regulator)